MLFDLNSRSDALAFATHEASVAQAVRKGRTEVSTDRLNSEGLTGKTNRSADVGAWRCRRTHQKSHADALGDDEEIGRALPSVPCFSRVHGPSCDGSRPQLSQSSQCFLRVGCECTDACAQRRRDSGLPFKWSDTELERGALAELVQVCSWRHSSCNRGSVCGLGLRPCTDLSTRREHGGRRSTK